MKRGKDFDELIKMLLTENANFTENEYSLSVKIKKRYLKKTISFLKKMGYPFTKGKRVINIPLRDEL